MLETRIEPMPISLDDRVREFEAGLIRWALDATGGNKSKAATLLRIPTLIHEGNVIPGRTNRWLARLARRVAVTYEESLPYFPPAKIVR